MNYTSEYFRENIDSFPLLNDLVGIPQPEKWHPEGDTFEHTMMVLDQANARYPGNNIVQLAAICHDLGKAKTNPNKWPSHYGHAQLGIEPTGEFLRSINEDEQTIREVQLITKYHMHIHDAFKLKLATYVNIAKEIHECCNRQWNATYTLSYNLAALGRCDHYGRGNVDQNAECKEFKMFWAMLHRVCTIQSIMTDWHATLSYLREYKSIENARNEYQ